MKSDLTSSSGVRLIHMPPGSFIMGSPPSEVGRQYWEEQREVTLPSEFYLGATPVTQGQFERLMPGFPRQMAHHPTLEEDSAAADVPVDSVWSHGPIEFCARLTQLDRDAGILRQDWEYRLPTEAEWEYACRAGTSGATYAALDSIAWHFGNSDQRPHPVCQKSPNPWGFYDMLGNVWEMCQDWFSVTGRLRAARGGAYFNTDKRCRAAARTFYSAGRYSGFRLAAAPVGPLNLCPSIEQYPAPPPKPSIWGAVAAQDYALAEQILAEDPDQLEGVDDIPPSLHGCIYEDLPEMFQWLVDHGANLELREQDYGSRPLATAVIHRHQKIIRILVARGADTTGVMQLAERGLAGDFEDLPPAEAYREIIKLLQELGVK